MIWRVWMTRCQEMFLHPPLIFLVMPILSSSSTFDQESCNQYPIHCNNNVYFTLISCYEKVHPFFGWRRGSLFASFLFSHDSKCSQEMKTRKTDRKSPHDKIDLNHEGHEWTSSAVVFVTYTYESGVHWVLPTCILDSIFIILKNLQITREWTWIRTSRLTHTIWVIIQSQYFVSKNNRKTNEVLRRYQDRR